MKHAINPAAGATLAIATLLILIAVVANSHAQVGPSATQLDLSSVAYPTPPVTGGLLTYAFKVWNKGSEKAVHEVLTAQVPGGTTFASVDISGTAGLGFCTTPVVGESGPMICKENSVMRPGSTWTIRLTVKITAPAGTVLTQAATATSDNTPASSATIHNTVR